MKKVLVTIVALLCILIFVRSDYASAIEIKEKEKNNNVQKAQQLSVSDDIELTGILSNKKDEDWYIYTMPIDGTLTVSFSNISETSASKEKTGKMEIFDISMNKVYSKEWVDEDKLDLGVGFYYVKVYSSVSLKNVKYHIELEAESDNETTKTWISDEDKKAAYNVEFEKEYYSDIKTAKQKDEYLFNLDEDGVIWFTFRHEIIEDKKVSFLITLYDAKGKEMTVIENMGNTTAPAGSRRIGLAAGEYKAVFSVKNYSAENIFDHQYCFAVMPQDSAGWEKEFNDKSSEANLITMDEEYHGSLMSKKDKDWYSFEVKEAGKIKLSFANKKEGKNKEYWKATIYDSKVSKLTSKSFKSGTADKQYSSEVAVKPGKYYVCVEAGAAFSVYEYFFTVEMEEGGEVLLEDSSIKAPVLSVKAASDEKSATIKLKKKGDADGFIIFAKNTETGKQKQAASIKTKKKKSSYSYTLKSLEPGEYEIWAVEYKESKGKKSVGKKSSVVTVIIKGDPADIENPDNGNGTENPDNGNGTEDPDNGNGTENPDNGNGTENPDNGNGTENPDNGNGTENPDNGNGTENPDNGNGTENPDNGNGTENPDNGNGTENPDNGNGTENPDNGDDVYVTKTDDTFWDNVTDFSNFEPGIYDRFGNLFFSYIDFWEFVTREVKYNGQVYTVFECADWDNYVMDYLGWWECEKWVSHIKKVYHMDITDNDSLNAWADEYDKDNVVILPEVWGVGGICESYRSNDEKMVVLPKSLKVLMRAFNYSNSLTTIIVPENIQLLCFCDVEMRECPKLSVKSKNAINELRKNALSYDGKTFRKNMEVISPDPREGLTRH